MRTLTILLLLLAFEEEKKDKKRKKKEETPKERPYNKELQEDCDANPRRMADWLCELYKKEGKIK